MNIYLEYEFLWQHSPVSEDHPSDTDVGEAEFAGVPNQLDYVWTSVFDRLLSGGVDGFNTRNLERPLQIGMSERSYEASACGIYVNRDVVTCLLLVFR
jgi:hypothetical protein